MQVKGTVTIISVPMEAEVYFDGVLQGKTPLTIKDILIGEHKLE